MHDSYVSFWAGDLTVAKTLPHHLQSLYSTLNSGDFVKDPEVCSELELVPIPELLEPFEIDSQFRTTAVENATSNSLRLAAVVVAVYTRFPLERAETNSGCKLRFIGSFPRL